MVFVYSWDLQVERKIGENVRAAAQELERWADGPQKSEEVALWGKQLARMIAVFMPEQVDEAFCWEVAPDGTKVPGTEGTMRQCYPEMCPAPGQAWVYISDMSLDYPEEVMSKTSELFEKHGCLRFGMLSSKTGVNNSTT